MKTVVFCEGTTDLLMVQFVLQYRYGWRYDGFVENTITNRLLKRKLVKDESNIEMRSCGGIMNIPKRMKEFKEQMTFATRKEEIFNKIIVLFDHDTVDSNKLFIDKINENLQTHFVESDINIDRGWNINNLILGEIKLDIHFRCLPETETGAIETIMLQALSTDSIEKNLIKYSENFIWEMA